jgi:hypothetical protein
MKKKKFSQNPIKLGLEIYQIQKSLIIYSHESESYGQHMAA